MLFHERSFLKLGKRKINEQVKNILITLGGADPLNLTPKILKNLDRISQDFKITVVIGPFFENKAKIEKVAKEIDRKVELIYDSHKMSKIILASDLAVTAGGTTLYELAATGTPALAFCLVVNQKKNIEGMAEAGTLINMGQGNEWREEELYGEINNLTNNYVVRERMGGLGQELTDGKGSWRVSEIIIKNFLKGHRRKK